MLSSHLVADLERVCDFVIVLVASRVRVAGTIEELLATHHRLVGPRDRTVAGGEVIEARHTDDHSTLLVRSESRSTIRLDGRAGEPGRRRSRLHGYGGPIMIRLTWRQFRTPAAVAFGALVVVAVFAAVTGPNLAHVYAATMAACRPTGDCSSATRRSRAPTAPCARRSARWSPSCPA